MSDDPRIQQMLDQLADSDCTPEEICTSCPELLPEVHARWRRMRRIQADLDALFPSVTEPGRTVNGPEQDIGSLPRLPGYEVEALLGRGGMGVVFRARHLRLNRSVALKMMLAGAFAGKQERQRFQREAEAVASLRHPNVVQVYDVGDHEGQPFFTMEFIEGGSLSQHLKGTPQPARQAATLLATLAEAVEAAHQAGIVHRDLKPANVLLTADGTPKISDFGLARRLDGDAAFTNTGIALGTPSYMAPEQAAGKHHAVGPAADIYALGAILYELQTGRPPFRAETPAATIQQVIAQEPVPPSRLNGRMPADLETICLECLHKDRERRYPTALALAEDLQRFLEGRPILARPAGSLKKSWRWCRRNPRETALVGLALLALVLIGSWAWWSDRQRVERRNERAVQESRTRRGAEAGLEQARAMRSQARWTPAQETLEHTALLLGDEGFEDVREELDEARRDLKMAEQLDGISQAKALIVNGKYATAQAVPSYTLAFRNFGLDLTEQTLEELAARIRGSAIRKELVDALDDWAMLEPSDLVVKLAALASAADPAEWRDQVRQAIAQGNLKALARLAEAAPPTEQSVPLLVALGRRFASNDQSTVMLASGGASAVGRLAVSEGPVPLLVSAARIPTWPNSIGFMRRLQLRQPADFWVNLTLGNALAKSDPEEAVGFYRAALAIRPNSVAVHTNLGVVLDNKHPEEAIDHFREAIKIDPKNVRSHGNLGIALKSNGLAEEAIAQLELARELGPNDARANYDLGAVFLAMGRTDEAIVHLRKGLELAPDTAEAHDNLGSALLRKNLVDEAIEHFRQALRTDPLSVPTHNHLSTALALKGRKDEAIDQLRQSVRLTPGNAKAHKVFSLNLARLERFSEALEQMQLSIALDPNDTEARGELRKLMIRQGRTEEVRSVWERALEANPLDHDARDGYAELCLFLGKSADYHRACRVLFTQFGSNLDPQIAERTGRACLLAPASPNETEQAAALIDRALAATNPSTWTYPYCLVAKSLAEYRLGRFDSAASILGGGASKVLPPLPQLMLAMSLHRLGRNNDARKLMARTVFTYDWRSTSAVDREAWMAHVLRREAEQMILPDLPAFLSGQYQPRDNDERLALMGICQSTSRTGALARLYADAFSTDPRLMARYGPRYNAAKTAALAGCGRGMDVTNLSEEERMRWRTQSRQWLRMDLAVLSQAPTSGRDADATRDVLTKWRVEPDLAGLREPTELNKLTAAERRDWVGFWQEVAKVLERVNVHNK